MGKLRTFSPAPSGDLIVDGQSFRRYLDPTAAAVRNTFRQVVDPKTNEPEVKTLLEGQLMRDTPSPTALYKSRTSGKSGKSGKSGNMKSLSSSSSYKYDSGGIGDGWNPNANPHPMSARHAKYNRGAKKIVGENDGKIAAAEHLRLKKMRKAVGLSKGGCGEDNADDCDTRRGKDPRFHAINNQYKQTLDPDTGRTEVASVLGGAGIYEKRNPDHGSELFKRTAKRGANPKRAAYIAASVSMEATRTAVWEQRAKTKNFIKANKVAAKKGEFTRGAGAAWAKNSRLRPSSAPAGGRTFQKIRVSHDINTHNNSNNNYSSDRPVESHRSNEQWGAWDVNSHHDGNDDGGHNNHSSINDNDNSNIKNHINDSDAANRYHNQEGAWSDWDAFSERGTKIVRGKSRPQSASARTRAVPAAPAGSNKQPRPMRPQSARPTRIPPRSAEHWSEWDAYSEHGKNIVNKGGEYHYRQEYHGDASGQQGHATRAVAMNSAGGRSSEHWSEWDAYSEHGNHITAGHDANSTTKKKKKYVRPQSARATPTAAASRDQRTNAHAATRDIDIQIEHEVEDDDNNNNNNNNNNSSNNNINNTQKRPTSNANRSEEHWSEWDAFSEHGTKIVSGQGNGQRAGSRSRARPQSARPNLGGNAHGTRAVGNSSIPYRLPVDDDYVTKVKRSLAETGTKPNIPASKFIKGTGPKVKSVTATREINLAVKAAKRADGNKRPVELAKTRVNDIAKVPAKGPSAKKPSESHRQFVKKLERMARAHGIPVGPAARH